MVEGIAFYALYKSRVLVIPCKDDFCLFMMKFKKSPLVSLSNLEFNFFIVLCSNLKKHYINKASMVSNIKNLQSVLEQC